MQKAKLTGRQVVAAVFAGIFGHLLFALGWITLGLVILASIAVLLLGGTIGSISGMFGEVDVIADFLANASGLVGVLGLAFGIGAVVLAFLGVLVSALILRGGKVRRPWATTWSAVGIAAVIDVPLLFVYASISRRSDNAGFFLVAILGTVVVGILVWLWMTWGHRGSASEFAGVSSSASGTIDAPAEKPEVEAAAEEAPVAAKKPATAKATVKKTPPTE